MYDRFIISNKTYRYSLKRMKKEQKTCCRKHTHVPVLRKSSATACFKSYYDLSSYIWQYMAIYGVTDSWRYLIITNKGKELICSWHMRLTRRGTDFPRSRKTRGIYHLKRKTRFFFDFFLFFFFFAFPMSSILLLMYLCVCESSHLKNI